MTKWVYRFGDGSAEGRADMRNLLGGKGAGLAEMSNLGLPVPPGFTITTEACSYFYSQGKSYPPELRRAGRASAGAVSRIRSALGLATPTTRCSSRCAPERASRCRA